MHFADLQSVWRGQSEQSVELSPVSPTLKVGLKDHAVYGWPKVFGRPITATELDCAECRRAVRNVYLAMDGRAMALPAIQRAHLE